MRQRRDVVRRRSPRAARDGGRFLPAGLVAVALVALLVAGAEVAGRGATFAGPAGSGALVPAVDLTATGATDWSCPGPLPLGASAGAHLSLVNATGRAASASVLVAETAVSGSGAERALPSQSLRLVVAPDSERVVPIVAEKAPPPPPAKKSTSGKKSAKNAAYTVEAAASVMTSGSELAVSEAVSGASVEAEAPCAIGSSAAGYTASGVTAGFSNLTVSLFNPTDAPAVVNVSVGTASGSVFPPNYEGVPVAPKSLALLDVGRYVPLRAHLAVSARAAVGRIVLGSFSTIDERVSTGRFGPGHSFIEKGDTLAVGVGRPFRHWVMPIGSLGTGDVEAVRLYDPTARTAVCSLVAALRPGPPVHASATIGPGTTVTAVLPVAGSPLGGAIEVACDRAVVAEHESYVSSQGHTLLESDAASPSAADDWLVPELAETPALAAEIDIASAGRGTVPVTLREISQGSPARPEAVLRTFSLQSGTSAVLRLSSLLRRGSVGVYGLQVTAGGPITVSGLEVPTATTVPPEAVSAVPAQR